MTHYKLQLFKAQGRDPKALPPKTRRRYIHAIRESDGEDAALLAMVDSDPALPVGLSTCYRYGIAGLCGATCPALGSEPECPTEDGS